MVRGAIMLAAVWLTACSFQPIPKNDPFAGSATTQWPDANGQEAIQFVKGFSTPAELGYRTSFSARFKKLLGGSSESHLVRPYAIDENQRWLVIADPGAGLVFCFDKERQKYSTIGASDSLVLSSPVGVALADGSLYVSDSALGKVFKFDEKQRLTGTLEQFSRPTSLAWDEKNQWLYVTDTMNHNIVVLDEQGAVVRTIGSRGNNETEFNFPTHIALNLDRLFVVDAMNFRVQILSAGGEFLGSFGIHGDQPGHIAQPKGIAIDSDGHVYIVESVSGLVQIFDIDGNFLQAFGAVEDATGSLLLPAGIHIEGSRIYVADSGNGRVQVFQYRGAP